MFIKGIRISIETDEGPFGFLTFFSQNLNIIRGRNSAGKSTIVQGILYALGMEQILGAQNAKALTYVLKDYVEHDERKYIITRSWVTMELESHGKTITVTRKIKDENFDARLIEIQECSALTLNETAPILYRYLHDGGSAMFEEGYYTYLENFLGLNLPTVPDKSGSQKKLYLQYVFAALAIEQKRGWTDYIANLPYFGIRDARIKVVDYLIGTNVFELDAERAKLDHESQTLHIEWTDIAKSIYSDALKNSVQVLGLPRIPTPNFKADTVKYIKRISGGTLSLSEYKNTQFQTLTKLQKEELKWRETTPQETLQAIELETENLQRLAAAYEACMGEITLHRASRNANLHHLKQAQDELLKNEATDKLIKFGASLDLHIAKDVCPACYQSVGHSLTDLPEATSHMDIKTNIDYLKSQIGMLERDNIVISHALDEITVTNEDLSKRISTSKARQRALRSDLTTTSTFSKANFRQQMQAELNLEEMSKFVQRNDGQTKLLEEISVKVGLNQTSRTKLPTESYSDSDKKKYDLFSKFFRSNIGEFDYHSAPIKDIKFNLDNLLPELEKIELREIQEKSFSEKKQASMRSTSRDSSNIAFESSASDFVRLIWSYILTLYETSSHQTVNGNHPGFLLLDEPGQHSMATKSQQALFKRLSAMKGLQSIVAASFDDSEPTYREATANVQFKLIKLGDKAIVPNGDTIVVGE
ncbi:AAA family ATPase [Pseudomonas syringae]|uniref:AAA family ATPase n=1 Tax=Pseudomonas syringae TaxID=317 RepID=UPI003F74CFB3